MRPAAEQATSTQTLNRAPRFSFGWVIVVASFVLLIGSFGTQLTFGVFLKPLAEEFGWTRAAASGAMSLAMGLSGIVGVVMGRLTDRFDIRIAVGIAMALGAACYGLLANLHSLWELYLYFGLGGGICIGSTYAPVSAIVSKWFVERRALALGVALMGITAGQIILSPVAAHLIETSGWRTAYAILGIILFVCGIPALFVLGRRPTQPGGRPASPATAPAVVPGMTTRQAARTAPFWMIMITGVAIASAFYIIAAHMVPAATDAGIAPTSAALILTVGSIGGIPGTIFGAWWLTKALGHRWALLVLCAGQAAALFLFVPISQFWAFCAVAVLLGFCFAASTPIRQTMVPPLFGLESIGAILGYAYLAWAAGALLGPFLAGLIYDYTLSYDLAFVLGGGLLLLGAASVLVWGGHRTKVEAAGPEGERSTAE